MALEVRYLQEIGMCPDLAREHAWLQDAARRTGKELPGLAAAPAAVRNRLGRWVTAATERRMGMRGLALRG